MVWGGLHYSFTFYLELAHELGLTKLCYILPKNSESYPILDPTSLLRDTHYQRFQVCCRENPHENMQQVLSSGYHQGCHPLCSNGPFISTISPTSTHPLGAGTFDKANNFLIIFYLPELLFGIRVWVPRTYRDPLISPSSQESLSLN